MSSAPAPLSYDAAFAAALVANPTPAQLAVWADWLEENGDPVCEGVRMLLVAFAKRPVRVGSAVAGGYGWFERDENIRERDSDPETLNPAISKYLRRRTHVLNASPPRNGPIMAYGAYRPAMTYWYDWGDMPGSQGSFATEAEAIYTAMFDVAEVFADLLKQSRSEPRDPSV